MRASVYACECIVRMDMPGRKSIPERRFIRLRRV